MTKQICTGRLKKDDKKTWKGRKRKNEKKIVIAGAGILDVLVCPVDKSIFVSPMLGVKELAAHFKRAKDQGMCVRRYDEVQKRGNCRGYERGTGLSGLSVCK